MIPNIASVKSLENLPLYYILMGWRRVRDRIQLLLRDPEQSPLQITSIVLEVPVVSHRKKKMYRIIVGRNLLINDLCLWSKILMTINFLLWSTFFNQGPVINRTIDNMSSTLNCFVSPLSLTSIIGITPIPETPSLISY